MAKLEIILDNQYFFLKTQFLAKISRIKYYYEFDSKYASVNVLAGVEHTKNGMIILLNFIYDFKLNSC